MSGGRSPRQKGNRAERALVAYLQDRGFAAERVPLSGSAGGSYLGDLTVPLLGADRTVEVKVRSNGFRELYRWLEARDLLIVRADRHEPLVVIPLRLAADIALAAEQSKHDRTDSALEPRMAENPRLPLRGAPPLRAGRQDHDPAERLPRQATR